MVYQKFNLQNDKNLTADIQKPGLITASVDEKPGVQAIDTVAPEWPPKPGKHKSAGRDYEYKRLGTVSILAALDFNAEKI